MSKVFEFPSMRNAHKVPFLRFTDASNKEFVDSNLYHALNETSLFDQTLGRSQICDVSGTNSYRFQELKGDYDYLTRWYHNPFKGANTRHGSYIMLYWIDTDYYWKLSQSFFTKLLTLPDNIDDIFDFG